MILELPPANRREAAGNERRVPATISDVRRRPVSAVVRNGTGYADVMDQVDSEQALKSTEPASAAKSPGISFWQQEEFGFGDFLDIVNPLHHIPIVATIYRNFTADKIGMVPRVVGGALWGRVGGLVAGLVNAAVEMFTGKDLGDHIFAALWGEPTTSDKLIVARAGAGAAGDCNELAQDGAAASAAPTSVSLAPAESAEPQSDGRIENLIPDPALLPPPPTQPVPDAALLKRLYNFQDGLDRRQFAAVPARGGIRLRA